MGAALSLRQVRQIRGGCEILRVDGLDVVRRILAGAAGHLTPHGALFVEVGDSDQRVQQAFPDLPFTWLEFEHGGGGVFLLRRGDFKA